MRSAEQGNALAQFALGAMHGNGQGRPQDPLKAYMWIQLGSDDPYDLGTEAADVRLNPLPVVDQWRENLRALEDYLTPAEVAQAKAMAAECLAKVYIGCG